MPHCVFKYLATNDADSMNSDLQTRSNTMTSAVNEDNNNGLHSHQQSDVVTTGHQDMTNDRDVTTSGAVLEDNVIFQTKSKQVSVLSSSNTENSTSNTSNPASNVAIIQEQNATTTMS